MRPIINLDIFTCPICRRRRYTTLKNLNLHLTHKHGANFKLTYVCEADPPRPVPRKHRPRN